MMPVYLAPLANHLWQSTLFAVFAGLLTLMLQKKRAAIRHRLWLAASLKFLIPFSLLTGIGSHLQWRMPSAAAQAPISIAMVEVGKPFAASSLPISPIQTAAVPKPSSMATILPALWFTGFATILLCWVVRWQRVRRTIRRATPVRLDIPIRVMSCPEQIEPGVFGVFRPVLLLPDGITDRLTPAHLEAVIAHELCHVRRRDNLTAAIQMFVEALFWFHPLVWWMRLRLLEEQERACDEEVLRRGGDPQIYAESILKICEFYFTSPLICVSGITGSDLKKRITEIMRNPSIERLGVTRLALLAIAATVTISVPILFGSIRQQMPQSRPKSATPLLEVASLKTVETAAPRKSVPMQTSGAPKWDTVSTQICGEFAAGTNSSNIPGKLDLYCQTAKSLIQVAYFEYAFGGPWAIHTPIEGYPAWVDFTEFDIHARAAGDASEAMMLGPMLQTILEEKFKLKMHTETRPVPVFRLTVADGGPKLQPFAGGTCVSPHLGSPDLLSLPSNSCSLQIRLGGLSVHVNSDVDLSPGGGNAVVNAEGISLDDFSKLLGRVLNRPVINDTGISGRFNIDVEYPITAPDTANGNVILRVMVPTAIRPGVISNSGGSLILSTAHVGISAAILEQLGLKLEAGEGPGEFLVVDHMEQPASH